MRGAALCAALMLAILPWVAQRAPAVVQPTRWHWITINGHRIYYAERGSGPTLVLLHGGGDSGEHSFEQQLDLFAQHHRIIAPDQVGQGHSPDVPGPLSYTLMMQDTAELLRLLKLRDVDVMGFSDGGILALMLAGRYPGLVRRLVISGVNIAPEGLTVEERDGLRAAQSPAQSAGTPSVERKLTQLWLNSPTVAELNPALLATIKKPVLVISGDRDAIRLEHTLLIYHDLPQAELCILPGTDHATFSGRAEWLNPIIGAFLDRP
jgi:pimeloyl-ACP methyl ester carboxylesterase